MAGERTFVGAAGPAIGVATTLQPTHSAGVGSLLFPVEHYTVHGTSLPATVDGAAYHVVPLRPGQSYLVGRSAPSMPVPDRYQAIPIELNRSNANPSLSRGQFRVESIEDRVKGTTAFALRHSVQGTLNRIMYDTLISGSDNVLRAALTASNTALELRDGDRITFADHSKVSGQTDAYFKAARILYREDFIDARGNIVAGVPFAKQPIDVRELPEGLLVLHFKGDAATRIDSVLAQNDLLRAKDGLPLYLRPNRDITIGDQTQTVGSTTQRVPIKTAGLAIDLAQVFADPKMEYAVIGLGSDMAAVAAFVDEFTVRKTGRAEGASTVLARESTMAIGAAAEAAKVCSDMLIMTALPQPNGVTTTKVEPVEGLFVIHRQGRVQYIPHGRVSEQGASTAFYFPVAGEKDRVHLRTGREEPIADGSALLPGVSPSDLALIANKTLKADMRNALVIRMRPFDYGPIAQATATAAEPATKLMDPAEARKFLDGLLDE